MRKLIAWAVIALIFTVTISSLSSAGKALKDQLVNRVNTIEAHTN